MPFHYVRLPGADQKKKKTPHPLKFKTISEFYQCLHYKIWNKDENMNEGIK